jgi:hypothetical protein
MGNLGWMLIQLSLSTAGNPSLGVCAQSSVYQRRQFRGIRFIATDRQKGHAEVRHLSFDEVADKVAKAGVRSL